jgi:excisionase family DNA binding protein
MDDQTNQPEPAQSKSALPRLWTVTEVATALRVSKMTIYRMVHSGELSHIRVGNSYRIPDDAVRMLLDGT